MNAYLQKYSHQHERKGMGRTYVAVAEGEAQILGYYTISSSAVAFETVPENLPRHPIPVALIGRLAVDNSARGCGLGESLLVHALRSAQTAAEIVGIYAVVVDALDEPAKSFYLKYGFDELADDQLHLFLPMKVIKQLKFYSSEVPGRRGKLGTGSLAERIEPSGVGQAVDPHEVFD